MDKQIIKTSWKMSDSERLREQLHKAIHAAGFNPQHIFTLLITFLRREFPEIKRENIEENGKKFRQLVTQKYPEGLGMSCDDLWRLVQDNKHPFETGAHKQESIILDMSWMRYRVRLLITPKSNNYKINQYTPWEYSNKYGVCNTITTPHPSTVRTIISRLKRDRPDLAEKVAAGELSANAAAIEAGFRKKISFIDRIKNLTDDELNKLGLQRIKPIIKRVKRINKNS
jgi:hypothetical protein